MPDAHDPSKRHAPMMATTDIAMITDPVYKEISKRFHENPDQFADAFARAWFKLLHRDMGPVARYLGPWVPDEELLWQDPIPAVTHELVGDADIAALKGKILDAGLSVAQLVSTAWASASTYRDTDKRGGANGARIRLSPQAEWDVNVDVRRVAGDRRARGHPAGVQRRAVAAARRLARRPHRARRRRGGRAGGQGRPGTTSGAVHARGAATPRQEQTDVDSFAVLEPTADGFRNYLQKGHDLAAEHLLIDKAFMLSLTAPEMTALVGGLRVLGANVGRAHGVLTDRPGTLTNDFFVNLLDMGTTWTATSEPRTRSRAATGRAVRCAGPAPASTSSSARTPSCGPSSRSTRPTTPRTSSSGTSWRRGTRSWTSTASS